MFLPSCSRSPFQLQTCSKGSYQTPKEIYGLIIFDGSTRASLHLTIKDLTTLGVDLTWRYAPACSRSSHWRSGGGGEPLLRSCTGDHAPEQTEQNSMFCHFLKIAMIYLQERVRGKSQPEWNEQNKCPEIAKHGNMILMFVEIIPTISK